MRIIKLLFSLLIVLAVVSCSKTTTMQPTTQITTEQSSTVSEPIVQDTIRFQYSTYSNQDIIIFKAINKSNIAVFTADETPLETSDILDLDQTNIQIKDSYLDKLSVGVTTIYLVSDNITYPIEITLTETQIPYVISSSNVHTDGTTDIMLQFEMFEGSLYSVNGTKTDTVLYSIDENILTIDKEFITTKFSVNNQFVLSYVINLGEDSTIGYLYFILEV